MSECECCGKDGAERYRQNTQYVDEDCNWVVLCVDCQKDNDAYWEERWSEYYAGCL